MIQIPMKHCQDDPRKNRFSGIITLVLACLLGAAAIIPYAQSYYFDFVWDDVFLIKNNPKLDAPGYLQEIWLTDYFHHLARPGRSFFWRPMVRFSMWLDYRIHDRDPAGFHCTNLILFGLLTAMLFILFRRFLNALPAAIATLLYAWHPLRVETVAWISARTEILALLFGVAGLILFLQSLDRKGFAAGWRLTGSVIALAVAMLSKESAILFPVLAVVLAPRRLKRQWFSFTVLSLPLAGWFAARHFAVGYRHWFPHLVEPRMIPAAAVRAAVHYMKVHVWPVGLSTEPWFDFPASYLEPRVVIGILIIAALVSIAVWMRDTTAKGIVWFFAALTPFLHILPIPERAADRYTTFASVGFVLALCAATQRIRNRWMRSVALVLLITAAISCAMVSAELTASWMTDRDIEMRAAEYGSSPQALFYRGMNAFQKQDYSTAYTAFNLAFQRTHDPTDVLLFNLALTEIQLQKIDAACFHLEQLLRVNPTHPMGGMILGELYMRTGKFDAALRTMRSQASKFPDNPVPHLVIGQIAMDFTNQPRLAEQSFREALRRNARGPQRTFAEERLRQLVQSGNDP